MKTLIIQIIYNIYVSTYNFIANLGIRVGIDFKVWSWFWFDPKCFKSLPNHPSQKPYIKEMVREIYKSTGEKPLEQHLWMLDESLDENQTNNK